MSNKLLQEARLVDPDNPWDPGVIKYINGLGEERDPALQHYFDMESLLNFGTVLWGHQIVILAMLGTLALLGPFIHWGLSITFGPLFFIGLVGGWFLVRRDRQRWLKKIRLYRRCRPDRREISDRIMELDGNMGPRVRAELDK